MVRITVSRNLTLHFTIQDLESCFRQAGLRSFHGKLSGRVRINAPRGRSL